MRRILFITCLLAPLAALSQEGLRDTVERFRADSGSLRRASVAMSEERRGRMADFYRSELRALESRRFDSLAQDAKVDYILLKYHLEYEARNLDIERSACQKSPNTCRFSTRS
jgi:hypothetical protein